MPKRDIIVIGASAGGVAALQQLVQELPETLSAAIFIVLHLAREGVSVLPQILMYKSHLQALNPQSGDKIEHGKIYVAPNDYHLLIEDDYVTLNRGPRENGFRPAVDTLFRSAAKSHGSRVIGIILTGLLDNGSAGLVSVQEYGGTTIIQDPTDALYPSMPENALKVVTPDYILPLAKIPELLVELLGTDRVEYQAPIRPISDSTKIGGDETIYKNDEGKTTDFICPECGGVMVEFTDGENEQLVNFRCRVGHRYSLHTMLENHAHTTENAMWAAVRALEESSSVSRRMIEHARKNDDTQTMNLYESKAQESEANADIIRRILLGKTNV